MALLDTQTASMAATGFSALPVTRQLGLLIGLAASIAAAIWIVNWSREPNYRPLYSQISPQAASEVIDVLQRSNIPYKLDNQSGAILVGGDKIHDARLKLASTGVSPDGGVGLGFLNKKSGLSNSQFFQVARYRHALEAELAKTITHFQSVKSARVHLAIPQHSAFVRAKQKASASVFLDLYSGARLEEGQISSIVHLVASSIPHLSNQNVTVVDENGLLLTQGNAGNSDVAQANRLFQYRTNVEKNISTKIEDILTPLLGVGKVTARVNADIDFSASEQTRESFNPDQAALRSEQILQEGQESGNGAKGVPGSLSNQPAAQSAGTDKAGKKSTAAARLLKGRLQSTKNYELNKTISHTQYRPGKIKRLTVAVVLDNKTTVDPKTGKVTRAALSEDELKQISGIVKNAIGFNPQRGDRVNVINKPFVQPQKPEPLPEEGLLQSSWFWDMVKQGAGGLFVLFMVFGVLMPTLKRLSSTEGLVMNPQVNANGMPVDPQTGGQTSAAVLPQAYQSNEERVNAVQSMAQSNPKQVAGVVKSWVDEG
jgi:flagellar M-ring protein FliF